MPAPARARAVVAAHPVPDPHALAAAADALWDGTTHREERYLAVALLDRYPRMIDPGWLPRLRRWIVDQDRWLRRTSVICQLGSRAGTDVELLTATIEANVEDPDFFLRKGIGWALRQHARVGPDWVRSFVAAHPHLSSLSRREALRVIDAR